MTATGALANPGSTTVAAGATTPDKAIAAPVLAKLGLGLLVALVVGSILGRRARWTNSPAS